MTPAIAVYFWPEKVQAGFTVLASLPEWYTWLCSSLSQAASVLRV